MKERWLWVLEKQDIMYGDELVPLGERWDEWMQSAQSYPFMPPILGRSETGQHDEKTNPVIGHVTEWRVMDRETALSRGIDTRGGTALYCKLKPMEGFEARCKAIAYVSPSLIPGYTDETGQQWPLVIPHVAEVSVPFQQLTQPDQRTLLGIQMSRPTQQGVIHMAEVKIEEIAEEVEAVMEETEAAVEEAGDQAGDLAAVIDALNAEIAGLRAEVAALKGDEEEVVVEAVPLQRSVSSMVSRELDLHRKADDLMRTRQWAGTREELINLCRDNRSYLSLQKSLAVKPNAAPRVGEQKAKAGSVDLSRLSVGESAKLIAQREGLAFSEALKRAKAQRGGK